MHHTGTFYKLFFLSHLIKIIGVKRTLLPEFQIKTKQSYRIPKNDVFKLESALAI